MNPNTGQLYPTMQAATLAGVANPVQLLGDPADITRISNAVARVYSAEQKAARKRLRKQAQGSRRANRR